MSGWTVGALVQRVQKRTENRANKLIDMNMEFFLALDEFCLDQHFWWRKKRGSFTTAIGTQSYDLSAAAGGTNPDLVELEEVILMNADGITVQAELNPIVDPQAQLAALLNTVQDTPSAFFIDPSTGLQTLILQAPPNVAQKICYEYWAIPMVTDPTQDTIPLVPGYLHWGLGYALEMRVYEVLYGQEDPRFTMAQGRYEQFKTVAARAPNWTGRSTQEARTTEDYASIVQAHG